MNDECFAGRVALLTGAASGMGLRASERLAKAGARVVMCDINGEALEKAAAAIRSAGGTVETCVVDVRRFADAERAAALALEKFGAIFVIFHTVAIYRYIGIFFIKCGTLIVKVLYGLVGAHN